MFRRGKPCRTIAYKENITMENSRFELNKNLAQMLKGGVIMDVTTPEQAQIAETAGACAVMALERIPADIRAAGGVSRMSDPKMIKGIQNAVSIPVMENAASVTLPRRRFCRQSKLTTSTRARFFRPQTMFTTSTKTSSRCLSYAARKISAKLSAEFPRVLL